MTANEFKRLTKDTEVYVPADDNDATYRVLDKKLLMGQIKMQKIVYCIDSEGFYGEEYDSFDEAVQAIEDSREEHGSCEAHGSDIEDKLGGSPFWMHYHDVELDY